MRRHFPDHNVRDIGKQRAARLSGDGVLHRAGKRRRALADLRSRAIKRIEILRLRRLTQRRDLRRDKMPDHLVGGQLRNECERRLALLRIVPRLARDEVARGNAADGLARRARWLRRNIADRVVVQSVGVIFRQEADLPRAVHQKCRFAVAEHGDRLRIRRRQRVFRERAQRIQRPQILQTRDPRLGGRVVDQLPVRVQRRDLQMRRRAAVVEHGKFKPVVRHLNERACNGGIPIAADRLAIRQKLLPCIVLIRHGHAAFFQHRPVDEQIFPVSHDRDGVAFSVGGRRELRIVHVPREIRVFRANFVQWNDLSRPDKRLRVRIREEEQNVRLGAGLKIGQHSGLPFLARNVRAVVHAVSRGRLIGADRGLKALPVAVLAAEGRDDVQRNALRLLHRLRRVSAAGAQCAQQRRGKQQRAPFFHILFSS